MYTLKQLAMTILAVIGVGTMLAAPVGAIEVYDACNGQVDSKICEARDKDDANSLVKSILSIMLWALGAVAVIVIVLSGFKYVTANGDQNKITSAKNTLLYAVIGLVVALFAQAIVLFVIDWV